MRRVPTPAVQCSQGTCRAEGKAGEAIPGSHGPVVQAETAQLPRGQRLCFSVLSRSLALEGHASL